MKYCSANCKCLAEFIQSFWNPNFPMVSNERSIGCGIYPSFRKMHFYSGSSNSVPELIPKLPKKIDKVTFLIEMYMFIDYRLGQRHRQSPTGVLVLRSCGTSQLIQYYLKVNLVNFCLFYTFYLFSP